MRTASMKELRENLAHYRDIVAGGETVTIMHRSRPVMHLTPVKPIKKQGNGAKIAKTLPALEAALKNHKPVLDPSKSWKQLYYELRVEEYLKNGT